MYEQALKIFREVYGSESANDWWDNAFHSLGNGYKHVGDNESAELMHEEAPVMYR